MDGVDLRCITVCSCVKSAPVEGNWNCGWPGRDVGSERGIGSAMTRVSGEVEV
jgi:hypothetical protein